MRGMNKCIFVFCNLFDSFSPRSLAARARNDERKAYSVGFWVNRFLVTR